MIVKMYCIKDVKTNFWKPHCQVNDLAARREFENLVNSPKNDFIFTNYSDLELWYVGEFDDVTGIIKPDLMFVCSGLNVKKE